MSDQLDAELENLRIQLRAAAARGAESEQVLADVRREMMSPIATQSSEQRRFAVSDGRGWMAFAASVVLVGGGLFGATVLLRRHDQPRPEVAPQTSQASTTTSTATSTTSSTPTTTTVAPATVPTSASPVAVHPVGTLFEAHFLDPSHGWVVTPNQSGIGVSLWTTDDGENWLLRTLPGADVYSVTMADTTNGWALGSDIWWSTHDGGASWDTMPSNGFPPSTFNVVGDSVYALIYAGTNPNGGPQFSLQRSPIDHDAFADTGLVFSKGAGGNDVYASIAEQGDRTFVSFNDRGGQVRRLLAASVDENWRSLGVDRGGNIYFTAAPDGGPLYTYSETGIWGGDGDVQLVAEASIDGGDTFEPVPMPDAAVADGGRSLIMMTAVDARTVIAQVYRDSLALYVSHDVGATWEELPATPPGLGRIDITSGIMWGLVSHDSVDQLWVSTDGGDNWRNILG